MGFLSDLLLAAGAFGAALYCLVLSRRLKALTALDGGLGSAIAVLSAQVDDLGRALRAAQEAASGSGNRLAQATDRAEAAARRLELLVAALHDLPDPAAPGPGRAAAAAPPPAPPPPEAGEGGAVRSRILRRRGLERAA